MKPGFAQIMTEPLATTVVRIQQRESLGLALAQLNLVEPRPTLVIVGGASKLEQADYQKVLALFTEVLAPLAEQMGLYVVDGGTDSGVMRLMGHSRVAIGGHFPLIGVAPAGLVDLPMLPATEPDSAPIEANHTHCLLIPEQGWGSESPWIAEVASLLAAGQPSMSVLINGGDVTWHDAEANVAVGRPVIIVAGSGRTADILADAVRGEPVDDARAQPLVASGLLQVIDLDEPNHRILEHLRQLLGASLKSDQGI
jgi:SLOG in TRPM, prokaryote